METSGVLVRLYHTVSSNGDTILRSAVTITDNAHVTLYLCLNRFCFGYLSIGHSSSPLLRVKGRPRMAASTNAQYLWMARSPLPPALSKLASNPVGAIVQPDRSPPVANLLGTELQQSHRACSRLRQRRGCVWPVAQLWVWLCRTGHGDLPRPTGQSAPASIPTAVRPGSPEPDGLQ